jgi:hypothetical protein
MTTPPNQPNPNPPYFGVFRMKKPFELKTLLELKHLPYVAAVFQSAQFAHAGSVYFGPFGWVIGAIGGVLANLAVASAASRISDISNKRKRLAYIFGALLLLISPAAIAPAAYILASAVTLEWARIMVAVVWALIPDLSIALVGTLVGKGLIGSGEQPKGNRYRTGKTAGNKSKGQGQAPEPGRQATPQPKPTVARKKIDDAELLAFLQANAGASQQQVADHFGVTRQAIGPRVKKLYAVKP